MDLRDLADVVGFAGFRRLARRYWRTGASEMWRDWSARSFLGAVRRYLPEIGPDKKKKRVMDFLLRRGFEVDIVIKALRKL